jgi:NAD(P)-dependent dehydrogenase (short-subunit alcohol dehydrogenase family)
MPTTLIIGGTSGIGLATAELLSRRGDTVHVAARRPGRLPDTGEFVNDGRAHTLDANDAAAVRALCDKIGPIDRLIITVAGSGGAGALSELSIDSLRHAFDEKYWPTLTALQASLIHLRQDASITLLGAITARSAMPGTAGIGSLNAAVEGLVQPLAAELAPIRVNAVSPGYVDTPWWDALPADDRAAIFSQVAGQLPTRRIATASDLADAVALLATNSNITGTVLEADGGAHLAA